MGNGHYEIEEVLVTTTAIDASTEFTFEITSMDDNAQNNEAGLLTSAVESTNNVRFTLNLDAYPRGCMGGAGRHGQHSRTEGPTLLATRVQNSCTPGHCPWLLHLRD